MRRPWTSSITSHGCQPVTILSINQSLERNLLWHSLCDVLSRFIIILFPDQILLPWPQDLPPPPYGPPFLRLKIVWVSHPLNRGLPSVAIELNTLSISEPYSFFVGYFSDQALAVIPNESCRPGCWWLSEIHVPDERCGIRGCRIVGLEGVDQDLATCRQDVERNWLQEELLL